MAKWRTHRYRCRTCEAFKDELLDMNDTPDFQSMTFDCECGETMEYALHMESRGFNTAKMSQSLPDGVRKFTKRRDERRLERAIKKAKKAGDMDTVVEASKESLDKGVIVKGVADNAVTRNYIKGKGKS